MGLPTTYDLGHGVHLMVAETGGTAVFCEEMDTCPCCNGAFCFFDCDGSKAENSPESEDDARSRLETNCRIEGMLSLLQNLYSSVEREFRVDNLENAISATMTDIDNRS